MTDHSLNTPPAAPDTRAGAPVSALVASAGGGVTLSAEGEIEELDGAGGARALSRARVLVCHAGFTARRLGLAPPARRAGLFDIMELWAFVRPARPCVPTPKGLAQSLGLPPPEDPPSAAALILQAAQLLLTDLGRSEYPYKDKALETARTMGAKGWSWAPDVIAALGEAREAKTSAKATGLSGLEIWNALPDWEDRAPPGAPGSLPVMEEEARTFLADILKTGRKDAQIEERGAQQDYTAAVTQAFAPRNRARNPEIVLAEAGTGIGKTLGYLAPASLWAARNGPGLWISTYTKNLQRQIDQELGRLYPDAKDKARRTLVRKGRENYLCLLNFQDKVLSRSAIEMGLIARWARFSRDGDMAGGDFPAWITPLFHADRAVPGGLTDRRGECVYAACPHYRKCFIEKAVRKARHTDIVVANHALVMVQAALDGLIGTATTKDAAQEQPGAPRNAPLRYIFDEGHHLFDAADSAFSSALSGVEAADLRRWIRGPEDRARRGRDLATRCEELLGENQDAASLIDQIQRAARGLPGPGWLARVTGEAPKGPAESFLAALAAHTLARQDERRQGAYDLEAAPWPPGPHVLETAATLGETLDGLARPLRALAGAIHNRLEENADPPLDAAARARLESLERSLMRRGALEIPAWQDMLKTLAHGPQKETAALTEHPSAQAGAGRSGRPTGGGREASLRERDKMVDWFGIARKGGQTVDIGMHRHWIDPTEPFARDVLESAHGALITSATLKDEGPPAAQEAQEDDGARARDWQSAEMRTGAGHLAIPARRHVFPSPFDYGARTRVFIVKDVSRTDRTGIAAAYQKLFTASGGGALGLFTSIAQLRHTYQRIAQKLESQGLPLYAQHMDAMDTGTLVDIFRLEENACLLGTDALRDGIDVPGVSLRLIVFDRVPWPRPSLLHKARRAHFGGAYYDDMATRLRLKQAFGRLMRRASDRGVFVMLDNRTPTRLTSAFPQGTPIERLGLEETAIAIEKFINHPNIE